jgi:hypothetical protein
MDCEWLSSRDRLASFSFCPNSQIMHFAQVALTIGALTEVTFEPRSRLRQMVASAFPGCRTLTFVSIPASVLEMEW